MLGTGSHLVDQALYLLGPAARVTAQRYGVGWEHGDNLSNVVIEHQGGAVSVLLFSSSSHRFRRRLELLGTSGELDIQCVDEHDLAFQSGCARLSKGGVNREVPLRAASWADTYRSLGIAVRSAGPPPVTHEEIANLQETLDACFESASRGVSVDL